jgi:hypothetical protein
MRSEKTLVVTVRYACPIEDANVANILERLAGDNGYAELVSTDIQRGTVAKYKTERAKLNAERAAARAERKGEKAEKKAPAAAASSARPGVKRTARKAEPARAAAG